MKAMAALFGTLPAAGGLALSWAFRPVPKEEDEEPVVMGYGDVKLLGARGGPLLWGSPL